MEISVTVNAKPKSFFSGAVKLLETLRSGFFNTFPRRVLLVKKRGSEEKKEDLGLTYDTARAFLGLLLPLWRQSNCRLYGGKKTI